jgi:transposase-like protein
MPPPARGSLVVDETSVKVAGQWCYLYRAIDQSGQVIDVLVSPQRAPHVDERLATPQRQRSGRIGGSLFP